MQSAMLAPKESWGWKFKFRGALLSCFDHASAYHVNAKISGINCHYRIGVGANTSFCARTCARVCMCAHMCAVARVCARIHVCTCTCVCTCACEHNTAPSYLAHIHLDFVSACLTSTSVWEQWIQYPLLWGQCGILAEYTYCCSLTFSVLNASIDSFRILSSSSSWLFNWWLSVFSKHCLVSNRNLTEVCKKAL